MSRETDGHANVHLLDVTHRRSSRVAIGILTVFLAATAVATPAGAFNPTGVKWSGPWIPYCNQAGMATAYADAATASADSWSNATEITLTPCNSKYLLWVNADGNNGYDGLTTWAHSGTTITSAKSRLNSTLTSAFSHKKKRAIYTHEIGHGLGLDHSSVGTIMYQCPACTYNAYGKYTPQPDDINGVNTIY